jgi:hypothetical protein
MGLEHWDDKRRKYLLYQSDEQHRNDCARFPFGRIPRRVFLDTNIINLLVKYSEQIFEHSGIPSNIDVVRQVDIEALMHVFHVGARADWDILGSPKTIEELSQTKSNSLRSDLVDYALGIVEHGLPSEDHQLIIDFCQPIFKTSVLDEPDRQLIQSAIALGCDAFCTCDRTTIIDRRSKINRLPIRIVTPAEWWASIKPWAGLWC